MMSSRCNLPFNNKSQYDRLIEITGGKLVDNNHSIHFVGSRILSYRRGDDVVMADGR